MLILDQFRLRRWYLRPHVATQHSGGEMTAFRGPVSQATTHLQNFSSCTAYSELKNPAYTVTPPGVLEAYWFIVLMHETAAFRGRALRSTDLEPPSENC